jgi:acyl carrier protein
MSAETTAAATTDAVLATLHTELVDAGVEEAAIHPEAALDDLDLTSLDIAEILAAVETRHGVRLQRSEVVGLTVGGLAAKVVASVRS